VARHRDESLLEVGAGHLEVAQLDPALEELAQDLLWLIGQEPDPVVFDLDRVEWQAREAAFVGERGR
jgi:hypothetical protein